MRLGITNCGPGLPRSPVTGLRRGEAPGDSSGKLPDMLWGSSESDTLDDMAGDDGTLMAEPGPKTPVKTGVMGCERPWSMSDDKDGDAGRFLRAERSDADTLELRLRLDA